MLKPKSAQESFYGSYLYDRIVHQDHLIRPSYSLVSGLTQPGYTSIMHDITIRRLGGLFLQTLLPLT
jgi:hypothetical protein